MGGRERLAQAREHLLNLNGDARERLLLAAREFEGAAAESYSEWPLEVRAKADLVRSALFRDGVPEHTIGKLDNGQVTTLVESLQRFCDEALGGDGRPY
jgi:hypothetical protein